MLIYVNEFSGYSAQTNMEPEWARAERLEYCEDGEALRSSRSGKSSFLQFIEKIFG